MIKVIITVVSEGLETVELERHARDEVEATRILNAEVNTFFDFYPEYPKLGTTFFSAFV